VEALVDDLRMEVQRLAQGREPKVFDAPPHWPSVAASSTSAPSGHGDVLPHRDGGVRDRDGLDSRPGHG
jgi:hypothetical protein